MDNDNIDKVAIDKALLEKLQLTAAAKQSNDNELIKKTALDIGLFYKALSCCKLPKKLRISLTEKFSSIFFK